MHEDYESDGANYSDHIDTDEMEEERLELEEEEIPIKSLFEIERLKSEPEEVFYTENVIEESFAEIDSEQFEDVKEEISQEVHEQGMFVEQMITDGDDLGKVFLKNEAKNKIILKIFECPFCRRVSETNFNEKLKILMLSFIFRDLAAKKPSSPTNAIKRSSSATVARKPSSKFNPTSCIIEQSTRSRKSTGVPCAKKKSSAATYSTKST